MNETSTHQTASKDAVELLLADHEKVKEMFSEYADLSKSGASADTKQELVKEIVAELQAHEGVENEVFFPAVRDVLKKDDVLGVVAEEQADAGEVIEELAGLTPKTAEDDARVLALGKQVGEHAAEEEAEVFPQVQASSVDTAALGEEMAEHKASLPGKV